MNTQQTGDSQSLTISINEYRDNKRKIIQTESDNYNKVVVIPCSGDKDWYEMAEHSALIYQYGVCAKIGKKVRIHVDTNSYYDSYKIGYVRSKTIKPIRDSLKAAELYQSEQKNGHIYIFTLNKTFTKQQIDQFKKAEEKERIRNLSPLPVHNLDPELYRQLIFVGTRLRQLCTAKLDHPTRNILGDDLLRLIYGLIETYHKLTFFPPAAYAKRIHYLDQMRRDLFDLILKIQIAGELKIWNFETCIALGAPLDDAYQRVQKQYEEVLTKQKSQSHPQKGGNTK